MHRFIVLIYILFLSNNISIANTIIVKNIDELNKANKGAKPGDIIFLQNGIWDNAVIKLNCKGTKELPITFKAQTAGKVLLTGNSKLKLGGTYITVDGLYFINGFSGDDAVIKFCIDSNTLANNCRVTNTVINDFNNPRRLDENYWVAFYGKNNRVDHCSFLNKKNIGVLLAVILDDERSSENFHSIDHNYFGARLPLASNAGEIIRVGVSQHCQFNSNTQIRNNFFEGCDGETEIVSIKSGNNSIEENVFKECQGSVVLRHGDNNLVARNFFLGNDKPGSGGVRVINKGQIVVSNIFYKCRGTDFRSPLAIMNGIPNSPANRYVQVTEADIESNTFYECAPVTFGEGSDLERSLPPDKVIFSNNTFYNTKDSIIYKIYDDINGIRFDGNKVSRELKQVLMKGFEKVNLPKQKPVFKKDGKEPQYPHVDILPLIEKETYSSSGASWFEKNPFAKQAKPLIVNCATEEEIYKQLEGKEPVIIRLTGTFYKLERPFIISKSVRITGIKKKAISFMTGAMAAVFIITGNGNLTLDNLAINGSGVQASHFIASDSTGSSNHYNLSVNNCLIINLSRNQGCESIFYAYKSMVADSIVFRYNTFADNNCNGLIMTEEKDNKGYYNAEKVIVSHNTFSFQSGTLLNIYRTGKDESTMGPLLIFSDNTLNKCFTESNVALLNLYGIQRSFIEMNKFTNCNKGKTLIHYEDWVRAIHNFRKNMLSNSGVVNTNQFVQSNNNMFKK